ncbi:ESX secretion-associated protein EspG [Nocardia sp. NPDC127579]|uniref:ESX secretion-associated protein EspG n=1 Tax=Nocardia sp. NPDC127579 TaxID=3345402 RepID=UPI00363D8D19
MIESDPVALDLNVDAALALQDLVGIESYPPVLVLLPNIYDEEDSRRVRAVVLEQLGEAGIIEDGRVHPQVEHWLRCLYRPDVELVARIMDAGQDGEPAAMLRLSLVRCADTHVLAVRCDDHVVIQPVFQQDRDLRPVAAALAAALGPCPALRFEPFTANAAQLAEIGADRADRRAALLELGAEPHTAGVLSRVLDEVVRRAELVMIEHRDGVTGEPQTCVSVLDTQSGRLVVTPRAALDGQIWSTFAPGDDAALQAGIAALVELLPGRNWFGTSRID